MIDPLFAVHKLNADGLRRAGDIAKAFNGLLEELGTLCPVNTREFALVRTNLEQACFFAKKAMANLQDNQEEKAISA